MNAQPHRLLSQTLPSPAWCRALDQILNEAESQASSDGFPFVVERSSTSEARYLHVCRNEVWYGIRVASHFPKYPCSRDYFQILLEEPPSEVAVDFARRQVVELVRRGGSVVGCPEEIVTEIERHRIALQEASLNRQFTHRDAAVIRHQMNQRAKWIDSLFDPSCGW